MCLPIRKVYTTSEYSSCAKENENRVTRNSILSVMSYKSNTQVKIINDNIPYIKFKEPCFVFFVKYFLSQIKMN